MVSPLSRPLLSFQISSVQSFDRLGWGVGRRGSFRGDPLPAFFCQRPLWSVCLAMVTCVTRVLFHISDQDASASQSQPQSQSQGFLDFGDSDENDDDKTEEKRKEKGDDDEGSSDDHLPLTNVAKRKANVPGKSFCVPFLFVC